MRSLKMTWLSVPLLVWLSAGCTGDLADLTASSSEQTQRALSAESAEDLDVAESALRCPFDIAADGTAEDSSSLSLRLRRFEGLAEARLPDRRDRIEVELDVRPMGSHLVLSVSFFNPYRCDWVGHLFLEREDSTGAIHTLGRRYWTRIPGGTRIGGRILLPRPPAHELNTFVARAYYPDGGDRKAYMNCLLSAADADPSVCEAVEADAGDLVLADEVIEASFEEPTASTGAVDDLLSCADPVRPPIAVDLRLRGHGSAVEIMTAWRNTTRRYWRGDLYLDQLKPSDRLVIQRRDLGLSMGPGMGFCTYDTARLGEPGLHVFSARALRRDGGHEARYVEPGTTEIVAVCNGEMCEHIEPEQERADIVLTGRSAIHLVSDYFSESTSVELAWEAGVFDITERCEIRQYPEGDRTHIEVHFDTMNLPIGPRTWGQYTIQLHPMPLLPANAKTSDSLWILTNGPE